jgi:O-antigen ligase
MDRPSKLPPKWLQLDYPLLRNSLCVLPYLSYLGLAGLLILIFALLTQFKRSALDAFTRNGLLLITGLLLLSCVLANHRAEAFLQLANFLPFFLLFSVVPFVLNSTERLEQLAWSLVITSIPINGLALAEYLLKSAFIPRSLYRNPIVKWARSQPHAGRAIVNFNHPNALASYLVLILGLGLGLIVYHALRQRTDTSSASPVQTMSLLYLGTYGNLIGIFCSGSRNGLLVAIVQIVLFGLLWGLWLGGSRVIWLTSLISLGGILAGAAELGIGGRSLDPADWADDPRLRVWSVSLSLWQQRPWFGWGLGNYKFQFADRLLTLYPACSPVRSRRAVPVECADVAHAHNFWLTMATEAGMLVAIGLILWVGYLCFRAVNILIFRQLKTPGRALLVGYLLAFLGCIAFACFDVTLYDSRVNTLNWVILAGIYAIVSQPHTPETISSL